MIENRDIHSYNCDVYIDHEKTVYQVDIADGLEISWERKGVAGKCTFSIAQEDEGKIEFQEGDTVRVRISKTWMFFGFIFTINRSGQGLTKIVCYDQLRYLKAKESVVFVNKTVGEIVTMIANDRQLQKGTIRSSKYKIPTLTKENATFFDIIMTAIEMTTQATGEMFVLYDKFGKLTLCNMDDMKRDVIIDASVVSDYDYESSIDNQTYNQIRVGFKSGKDGATVYKTVKDQKNIDKWGILQLTETADNGWIAQTKAVQLLSLYNSKTKTLKIRKAMGANELVAGAVVMVNLDLGDMKLTRNMVVDAITHRVEDGLYSMDLELIGGEFVSTRGVQGDDAQKNTSNNSSGGADSVGVGDWGHGVTAEQLNKVLKGPLTGMGDYFVKLGNAFGVNPMIVAMMIRIESRPTMDSGLALKGNNFGGINWTSGSKYPKIVMGGRAYNKYPSVEIGIQDQFRLLGVKYVGYGSQSYNKHTLRDIIMTYAPPSENDTNGYINNLKKFYQNATGVTWNDKLLGKGVNSEEEGLNNLRSKPTFSSSSLQSSSNDIIENAIAYAISRVGGTYSQSNRNSYLYASNKLNARSFDCSSLCYYAYMHAGFYGKPAGGNAFTTSTIRSNPSAYKLKEVPLSEARRGDILWRNGHAGLYLGNRATVEANSPSTGINIHKNGGRNFHRAYRPMI